MISYFLENAENGNLYFSPYDIMKLGEQEADELSVKVLEQIVGQLQFSKKGATANGPPGQKMETSNPAGNQDVNTGFSLLPLGNGVTLEHNKVLGVVYNSENEEGANVPDDFAHLQSE